MIRAPWIRLAAGALALVVCITPAHSQAARAALTASGTAILIDGRPSFLTGVSLFDALGAAPPADRDLDALKDWGVNTARVWAHWHEPIYQPDGALSPIGRTRVLALAGRLQQRGLILELVVLRPGQLPRQPFAIFRSEAARAQAVAAITETLRPFRNVLFDLYNEHDHPDGPITHAAARKLRDRVKAIDPDRLVTISSTESHIISPAGASEANGERNLRGEAGREADSVGVDIVAPHFPRTDDWDTATAARVESLRAALERMGSRLPIYLNEERRAESGAQVDPAAYQRAFSGAKSAGAAGWLFHTAAGFELQKRPFLEALAPGERAALQSLRAR